MPAHETSTRTVYLCGILLDEWLCPFRAAATSQRRRELAPIARRLASWRRPWPDCPDSPSNAGGLAERRRRRRAGRGARPPRVRRDDGGADRASPAADRKRPRRARASRATRNCARALRPGGQRPAASPRPDDIAVTVYDAVQSEARAWSGRPSDIPADRVVGPQQLFRDAHGARPAARARSADRRNRRRHQRDAGSAPSAPSTCCRGRRPAPRSRLPRIRCRHRSRPSPCASKARATSRRDGAFLLRTPAGRAARRRLRRAGRPAEGARRLASISASAG